MAKRFHPFPFRTRKLSSFTPTILDHLDLEKLGNAGSFQKVRSYGTNLFSLYFWKEGYCDEYYLFDQAEM